jgi:hypothetical protein
MKTAIIIGATSGIGSLLGVQADAEHLSPGFVAAFQDADDSRDIFRHKTRIRRYGNPGPQPAIPLPIWERLTFVKTKFPGDSQAAAVSECAYCPKNVFP